MLSRCLVATSVVAVAAAALAQPAAPVVTIHDISPNSANPLLSGNNAGLDIHVALDGAAWLTGGMTGTANIGSFRYAEDSNNVVRLSNTRQFDASDEVTMVSKPRGQTAHRRFRAHGAISNIPGSYDPGGLGVVTTSTDLNVAFADDNNDGSDFTETSDGFIMRIVLDLTGTTVPADEVFFTVGDDHMPSHVLRIAFGEVGVGAIGHPDALAQTALWNMWWAPEPGTFSLLVLGSLAAFRRR